MRAVFPTPFGAEDYENRGINDNEQRFPAYKEKVYASRQDTDIKYETNGDPE